MKQKPFDLIVPLFPVLFLVALWMLPGSLRGEAPPAWDLREMNGVEHVSVDQIQKFYGFTRSTRIESDLSLGHPWISVKLKIGSTDCTLNGVRIDLSSPVVEIGNVACISSADLVNLLDPILRPSFIKGSTDFKTVILDPACEAGNSGDADESGAGYALKIAELTREILEKKGYKVIMPGGVENSPSVQKRMEIANSVREAAIFIGISFNPGPGASQGIQTVAIPTSPEAPAGTDPSPDGFAASSVALSTAVHGSLVRMLGKQMPDGGIGRDRLKDLSEIRHPAILIKAGNLTDPREAMLIGNDAFRKTIARGIADGVSRYRFAVSSRSFGKRGSDSPEADASLPSP